MFINYGHGCIVNCVLLICAFFNSLSSGLVSLLLVA